MDHQRPNESAADAAARVFRRAGFVPSTPGQELEALSERVSADAAEWAKLVPGAGPEVAEAFAALAAPLASEAAATVAAEEEAATGPGRQMEALSERVGPLAAEWARVAPGDDAARETFDRLREVLTAAAASTLAEEASADDSRGDD